MTLSAAHNYSTKGLHGSHWGLNEFTGPGYRMRQINLGGDLTRLPTQSLEHVGPQSRILQFGHTWCHQNPKERTWFHPDKVMAKSKEFYFWDNSTLPHLLYKGPHNPLGFKNWMRIVPQHTMPQQRQTTGHHGQRINSQLRDVTGGLVTEWQQLQGTVRSCHSRSRHVLIILSSSRVYEAYAGVSKTQWLQAVITELGRQRMSYEVRDKHSRGVRQHTGELRDYLAQHRFHCTISFRSQAVYESLLAGVPAVNYLAEPALQHCVTPWEEFQRGGLRQWQPHEVEQAVESTFYTLYHKTEAYDGTWYDEQQQH